MVIAMDWPIVSMAFGQMQAAVERCYADGFYGSGLDRAAFAQGRKQAADAPLPIREEIHVLQLPLKRMGHPARIQAYRHQKNIVQGYAPRAV